MKSRCWCQREEGHLHSDSMSKSSNRQFVRSGTRTTADRVVGGSGSSACCTRTWKYWRHICCLHGSYPLAVAIIALAAFLLSLYSTTGCDYIAVDIGFIPSNAAYNNQSQANLGFFYLDHRKEGSAVLEDHNNIMIVDAFHGGCKLYSDLFQQDFIASDRTWRVARIMAIIAASAGLASTIIVWLMVVTPLSVGIFWPTLLLPLVMVAFIAEGSKFLLFDISMCGNSIWLPSGVDSIPQTADSCTLGTSAIYGMVSGALFLVALLLVCLYTPQRRTLDPQYGQEEEVALSSNHDMARGKAGRDDTETPLDDSSSSNDLIITGDNATSGEPASLEMEVSPPRLRDIESSDMGEGDIYTTVGTLSENRTLDSEPLSFAKSDGSSRASQQGGSDHELSNSPVPTMTEVGEFQHEQISESRLSKMEKLELSHASKYQPLARSSLLHQLVSELNDSLSTGTSAASSTESSHHQPTLLLGKPTPPAESDSIQRFL